MCVTKGLLCDRHRRIARRERPGIVAADDVGYDAEAGRLEQAAGDGAAIASAAVDGYGLRGVQLGEALLQLRQRDGYGAGNEAEGALGVVAHVEYCLRAGLKPLGQIGGRDL